MGVPQSRRPRALHSECGAAQSTAPRTVNPVPRTMNGAPRREFGTAQ